VCGQVLSCWRKTWFIFLFGQTLQIHCFNLFNPSNVKLTFKSLVVSLRTTRFNVQNFYMVLALRWVFFYGSQNKQRPLLCTSLTDWFFYLCWKVFTARYGLIPYMKHVTFRLLKVKSHLPFAGVLGAHHILHISRIRVNVYKNCSELTVALLSKNSSNKFPSISHLWTFAEGS
jgi:hypothetical protein